MECAAERYAFDCDECGERIGLDEEVTTTAPDTGHHSYYHTDCWDPNKHDPMEGEEEEEDRRTCPECGSKNAHEDPSSGAFVCWCDEEGEEETSARRKNNDKA
jgi:DNA-directed RNA polymerase subunit RPC12/RpoP